MISGMKSISETLTGSLTAIEPLRGDISKNGGLFGELSVSIQEVPYYETSNEQGGITVYIGKVVTDNGLQ